MTVSIDELHVADLPPAWRAAGFAVDDDGTCRVGSVRIRLSAGGPGPKGIIGWSLRGLPAEAAVGEVDGITTTPSDAPTAAPAGHPNGVTHIDHVVLLSPDLDRTVAALAAIGLEPRRERDGELEGQPMRQVFYRLGEVIVEVVGPGTTAGEGPSRLWGLTHVVTDIDATAAFLGDAVGPVKDAVQPGRRITTMRTRELGITVRTALISPHVRP